MDAGATPDSAEGTELIVLVRNLEQLEAVVEAGVGVVYCEFENPKGYRDAVRRFRAMLAGASGGSIWVVPPRITKPGEEWILKLVRSSEADGILARNHDHLVAFEGCRLAGDFSLNVANELTAEHYMRSHGLERVTASYDLNVMELEALLRAAPPAWFEITIHQHMPMFHMEHCVFCAVLSEGTDYTNCGRPCEKHDVRLRDRVGAEHPLKADACCRNTLYNALAQTGAEWVGRLMDAGARRFRIDLLNEKAGVAGETVDNYHRLIRGELSGAALWRRMRWASQLGVTRGQK
jgi:putative protease